MRFHTFPFSFLGLFIFFNGLPKYERAATIEKRLCRPGRGRNKSWNRMWRFNRVNGTKRRVAEVDYPFSVGRYVCHCRPVDLESVASALLTKALKAYCRVQPLRS